MSRNAVRILVSSGALALPLVLGGCISVFPKAKPVQMYRFGDQAPAPAAAAPAAAPVAVLKGPITFPPASGGDRILTVSGSQSAYVGGARWVAPAASLFDQALLEAFDAPGAPRLVARGEPLSAASTLRLDVRAFEARYPGPTVRVQVRATLTRNADRALIGEKMFDAQVPAADNRQGPIVAAFDQAVGQVLAGVRDWTAATAPRR
jgi:cholesterol transport system auxiliary component